MKCSALECTQPGSCDYGLFQSCLLIWLGQNSLLNDLAVYQRLASCLTNLFPPLGQSHKLHFPASHMLCSIPFPHQLKDKSVYGRNPVPRMTMQKAWNIHFGCYVREKKKKTLLSKLIRIQNLSVTASGINQMNTSMYSSLHFTRQERLSNIVI